MALLGLDIGTTGAKATVFDIQGYRISYAYQEYNLEFSNNRCELNPKTIFEVVKLVIKNAVDKAAPIHIDAICASSFGEAFVLLDKDGCELTNSPTGMDTRGEKECILLTEHFGKETIMGITGHPPAVMYSICKLMWLAKHEPGIMDKTKLLLFIGNYILYKLGGSPVTDYSLASRSMCFDIKNKKWSDEIISFAGLDIGILPEPMKAGACVGEIASDIALELGINKGAKLILGGHDQIMVAIGAGIIKPGQAVNGIGTVDCITPLFKGARINDGMLSASFAIVPYLADDTFVTYAFNFTGGSLLKWFRDTFAKKDKQIAIEKLQEIYDLLNQELPNEPTGIFVLPHFAGSPTPNTDIHAKGAIINLTLGTQRGEIYKACMEGEAFEMRRNIEALETVGIPINELRTVGGGARSKDWLKIRADIFNKKIVAMDFEEAGTLGTAILAGVASGCYSSVEEAASLLVKTKGCYYPDKKRSAYYTERYQKYGMLYEKLKDVR